MASRVAYRSYPVPELRRCDVRGDL